MALMPKRVKHRKSQRGRIKGDASRGNRVVFGEFGLQATQGGWLKAQTIEAQWPSGAVDTLKDVAVGQVIFIKEGAGQIKPAAQSPARQ